MVQTTSAIAASPEALVVALARTGDRGAFAELVRRRQSWLRNLHRRFCGDATLADDLAQQTLLQAWRDIGRIRDPRRFGAWLRRLAVNTWLKHLRGNDALRDAGPEDEAQAAKSKGTGVEMDVERALGSLSTAARTCVVLSYYEGMSHAEIAATSSLPLGTVKSHLRRATTELKELLAVYDVESEEDQDDER